MEQREFGAVLKEKLQQRGINTSGANLEQRRERLCIVLNLQRKYKRWKAGIDQYEHTCPNRTVPVENTIPCVFHMHSCITEKIVDVTKGWI